MKFGCSTVTAAIFISFLAEAHAARYVDVNNSSPAFPYSSWETAATNIQNAIDAASAGETIWVTNGVYATGTRVIAEAFSINLVAVTTAVTVQSVNGPAVTRIQGGVAIR